MDSLEHFIRYFSHSLRSTLSLILIEHEYLASIAQLKEDFFTVSRCAYVNELLTHLENLTDSHVGLHERIRSLIIRATTHDLNKFPTNIIIEVHINDVPLYYGALYGKNPEGMFRLVSSENRARSFTEFLHCIEARVTPLSYFLDLYGAFHGWSFRITPVNDKAVLRIGGLLE
jgi:hypothetical protein